MFIPALDALFINLSVLAALALLGGLSARLALDWQVKLLRALGHAGASLALPLHALPGVGDLGALPLALLAYRAGPLWAAGAALPSLLLRAELPYTAQVALLIALAALLGRSRAGGQIWWHPPLILGLGALPLSGSAAPAALAGWALAGTLGAWLYGALAWALEHTDRHADALRHLAFQDALTGLPHRRAFEQDWPAQQSPASALLLLDLDHFKAVNDQCGHEVGDRVLRAFAQVCREVLRGEDRLYRLGGEEFVALLPDTPLAVARQLAEQVRERVREQVGARAGVGALRVTVSGGLVPAVSGALERADALLYAAKAAGRDRVLSEFASPQQAALPPLNEQSPAWETVRSLLSFLAHSEGEPNMQGLLEAAVACVPGAEAGTVIVWNGEVAVTCAQVGFSDALLGFRHSQADMLRWHGDPHAQRAGRPRIVSGAQLAALINVPGEIPNALAPRSNLLPIVVDSTVLAELNLDSFSSPEAFGPESLRVAEEFGLLAAAALASGAQRQRERAAHEGALFAIGLALEARDHETHGHTARVVALSAALGEALGLDAGEQDALRQGAYLHDLGKLQVPDTILLKPGRLTDAEMRAIREHATIGASLAAYLPALDPRALEVIRHHHERFDGLGYPDGLSGEAIPRLARIFAVCDVYDALTSERPYKRAWSQGEAVQEIRNQAGRHFDPCVARVFVEQVIPAFEPGAVEAASGLAAPALPRGLRLPG